MRPATPGPRHRQPVLFNYTWTKIIKTRSRACVTLVSFNSTLADYHGQMTVLRVFVWPKLPKLNDYFFRIFLSQKKLEKYIPLTIKLEGPVFFSFIKILKLINVVLFTFHTWIAQPILCFYEYINNLKMYIILAHSIR